MKPDSSVQPVTDPASGLSVQCGTPASPTTAATALPRLPREDELVALAEGLVILDPHGTVLTLNEEAAALFGVSRGAAVGRRATPGELGVAFLSTEDGKLLDKAALPANRALATGHAQRRLRIGVRRPDGSVAVTLANAAPILGDDDVPSHVVVTFTDVTEQVQAERALRREHARLGAVLQAMPAILIGVDGAGCITLWNPAAQQVFGRAGREVVGRRLEELGNRFAWGTVAEAVRRCRGDGMEQALGDLELRGGRLGRTVALRVTPVPAADQEVAACLVVGEETTEQRRLQQRLLDQALQDPLTGLPNRYRFHDQLEIALRRQPRFRRVAVLFLDLDDFKAVNDSRGHDFGDALLRAVAHRLKSIVRAGETLARLGGDEFGMVIEGEPGDPERLAERLAGAFQCAFEVDGATQHVGCSIGLAVADDTDGAGVLLRRADVAMYESKDAGLPWVRYDGEEHAGMLMHRELGADLRRGVREGELTLAYQPIVDLRTGRTARIEALVRWRHPTHGLLLPGTFIPLAERRGVSAEISRWVLEAAVSDLVALHADDPTLDLGMSVNLSPRDLTRLDLVEEFAELRRRHPTLPTQWLTFEVTEAHLPADMSQPRAVLSALRAGGARIALDDFGTGHSSLLRLEQLEFDELKLDASFLGTENRGDRLLRVGLQLADAYGAATVAEGLETAGQMKRLRELGCGFAQGFFLTPPLAIDDVRAWLRRHAAAGASPVDRGAAAAGAG